MSDDDQIDPLSGGELDRPKRRGRPDPNAFAAAAALNASGMSPGVAAEAAAFLREQRELAALQVRYFDEDRLQANDGIKLRRAMDWMKLAMQVAITLVLITAAVLIGRMVWNAAHDHGLVIEGFTVPPDLATTRIDGNQLAAIVADKIAAIEAGSHSFRAEDTFSTDWGNDIKLDVPGTGLSLGELDRTLRRQLGHQTRIGGTLYHDGDGLKLSLHSGGESAINVSGGAKQIDALAQKAAEALVEQIQPYRYSKYLEFNNRFDEAMAVARATAKGDDTYEKAWALAQVSNLLSRTDIPACIAAGREAIRTDPSIGLAYLNTSNCEALSDHPQNSVALLARSVQLLTEGNAGLSAVGVSTGQRNQSVVDVWKLDPNAAVAIMIGKRGPSYRNYESTYAQGMAEALAMMHDISAARRVPGVTGDAAVIANLFISDIYRSPQYDRAADVGDWPGALAAAQFQLAVANQAPEGPELARYARERFIRPHIARALAEMGRLTEAKAIAATLPGDCYLCRRTQGIVAGLSGDLPAASRAFAAAVAANPGIAAADHEWGRMLFAHNDLDAAATHFSRAAALAPHWADPRKYLGDVAMARKDVAGAVKAFAEASPFAPRWGANNIAWGKALWLSGNRAEARKHWVAARGMDLSPADRAWLGRLMAMRS